MDNYIKDLDYEYTCKIKYDSAVPPAWDRTLNVGWSRLPRGSKEGEGDDVAAFKAMTASNTRKVGHWDYFTLPANVALKICRYIIQQHSTDKPIRLSRLSVYSGLYPITEDTDRDVWESEFFETPKQASRAVTPYLLVSRGFRTNLSAAFLLTRRYHFVVSPFDHVTDLNWLARNGPCLKNITMEFDCTRYYGGKPQTREKVEAAKHPGGVDKEQLKTALAPGKDARESVKHYKRVLLPMLEMLTSGREFPVNRLTIMVRKYQGSRESMPQGYPYFDPTWLNFLLVIPCVLQSNVRNLETIGVPPKLLGLIINRFWGEGKPPTEDAQRQHFTWSPSPPTLWPEMSGQSAAISVPGSLDLTVQYLLTLDHPGKVEIRAFPSQEAQKEQQEQQSAKKRKSKRKKKKTKKSSILPEEAPIPQPERVVEPEEQSGEQAHSQPPSRLSVMTPSTATATAAADVEADSSPEREPGAMRCLDRLGSWGLGRWWDGRKEAEPADQDAMSSPERKALHLQRARDKFMELSNLLEASFPAPPISSETLAAPGTGTLSTQTGLGVPRATLAGPLLPPPPKPATPQQPHSHLPVTPALPGPSAVSIPMPDGKRTRLTDEDRQPSSAGSTPNGNDAGDLSESRGSGDTRSGHRTASGSTSCPAAGNDIKTGTPQAGSSASTAIESKAPAGNAAAGTTTGAAAVEDNDKGLGLWETNNTTFSVEKGWIMVLRKKKNKNKKAGENKCVKPGGTSTSTSSSKEAESKAGLPQSPQAARPSPPPPSDLHIAGSNLGDSNDPKGEERSGSQSPPWLQWSSFSEASLPTPWLSMEVPKEQVLNESAEDVKAREGVDADQFNFPTSSQDTQVCSIVSTVARNPKAKGKARWTGSPKPPDEDKDVESTKVESNPVSRPQPQPQPQLMAAMHPLQPTIQVPTISPVPAVSQVQMQPMPQMQPIVQIFNYYQVPTTTMSQVPPNPPAHASQPTHPFQQPYQAPQSMYLGHERCNAQRCYQETPEHFHPPNMMVDGSWVYVAGARESDFRKQEGKKHGAEKPAPPKPETEEPETEKSAPSKLEQEQEQFQELSVEGEGEGDAAGGERPVSDDGQDHEELDHEQPDQEQLDQEQPDWDSWEWEQGDEGYVSEQSQDRLALLEQEVAQLLEEVQFLEEQDQDQG
ncbi:hypothetical protein B0H65DRAFT_423710 [Neurospora tetraspora]|uniref:Uncharacterized protein n=1 Tax=Neurospora tetraspora TaxID=94610 RepID=A0AAE0JH22_9PEZI|nr:hypothetical protein B0H65DRAFT_423710 [Neurospora tetraspora]